LATEEHRDQGERQNPNHGERDQRLAVALMHGWQRNASFWKL
jgi:hypothetical protein